MRHQFPFKFIASVKICSIKGRTMIELTSTLFESQLSLRALTFSSEMAACRTVLLKCYSELFEAAGSINTIINKLIRQTSMNKDAKRLNRGRIKLCPRSLRLHTNAAFVQANAKNQRTALQMHAWPVGIAPRHPVSPFVSATGGTTSGRRCTMLSVFAALRIRAAIQ
jgi:hypothetical protein